MTPLSTDHREANARSRTAMWNVTRSLELIFWSPCFWKGFSCAALRPGVTQLCDVEWISFSMAYFSLLIPITYDDIHANKEKIQLLLVDIFHIIFSLWLIRKSGGYRMFLSLLFKFINKNKEAFNKIKIMVFQENITEILFLCLTWLLHMFFCSACMKWIESVFGRFSQYFKGATVRPALQLNGLAELNRCSFQFLQWLEGILHTVSSAVSAVYQQDAKWFNPANYLAVVVGQIDNRFRTDGQYNQLNFLDIVSTIQLNCMILLLRCYMDCVLRWYTPVFPFVWKLGRKCYLSWWVQCQHWRICLKNKESLLPKPEPHQTALQNETKYIGWIKYFSK